MPLVLLSLFYRYAYYAYCATTRPRVNFYELERRRARQNLFAATQTFAFATPIGLIRFENG